MITTSGILRARILIVDDQEANVSLLEQMLEGAGYSSVTSTRDPHQVCELHRKNSYDLILLDLLMPGLDGFQVMEGLRSLETGSYLPVLAQTAQPDHKLRALAAGARDFVSKPFDLAEVLMRVHNLIETRLLLAGLKGSLQEVQDLNTEIKSFYHTLSHELKTPLTAAREFIAIVMDGLAGPLNATQMEYLSIAKESSDQLRLYINDLLDVTRLETGKMTVEFQTMPLMELVERVVAMLAPAAAGKQIRLTCECQPELPAVPIDRQRILQVLTNLTTNAIKFTASGGEILLILRESPADPDCLQIDVRDSGKGIPADDLDLIFDRLYQINDTLEPGESRKGLGLGPVHLPGTGRLARRADLGGKRTG